MNSFRLALIGTFLVSLFAVYGFTAQSEQLSRTELRERLVQLGYEVTDITKDPGKEKYSVTITRDEFNVPVAYEISPSNTFIWLTVNLGPAKESKSFELLKRNSKIQPCFFYVSDSGILMMGHAIENKDVANAFLRTRTDAVVNNVVSTASLWQEK